MIKKILKVFILEDLKTDLELTKRQVLKYNPNSTFTTANNKVSFFEKIEWFQPDVVISDYSLPDFNGLEALLHIKKTMPDIPFIFVTGTLNNDEKVANAVLQGADGFIIKQNLKNLPSVIEDVISKNDARLEALRKKEEAERQRKVLLNKLEAKIIKLNGGGEDQQEVLKIVKRLQVVT